MVSYFYLIQLHWVGCHPWSTMPPLEYDAPLVCVASPACGILKHMLVSFLIKLKSQIPFHIPTKHHTPSCTTNTTTEDFHSLHRSKVSKFDGIRLYARLFKTLEKPRFPPYSILSYSRGFYLRRGKQKKHLQVHFFFQYGYLPYAKVFWYTIPFVEYDDLWVGVWSAMGSSGVRWHPSSAMPHEYARPEIPWEKEFGPQFPKFNRADAGCCNLTKFQPTQQTSQTIFWSPLLLQSPKWETHLSGHALAHPGCIAFQEQHKASTWCQTISKLSWKVFPPQPVIHRCETCHTQGNRLGKQWVQRDRSGVRWIHGIWYM